MNNDQRFREHLQKRKKRVGIITMHRVINFGSALQAAGLQKALKSIGLDSEIIDYIYPRPQPVKFRSLLSSLKRNLLLFLSIISFPGYRKENRFRAFRKTYMRCTKEVIADSKSRQLDQLGFGIYLTGSDQVWNPKFMGENTAYMLAFVPDDVPKYAYAASFATVAVPEGMIDRYRQYLSRYEAISVREESGVKLAEDLSGRKVESVCDPSLLIAPGEWERYMRPVRVGRKQYALVYILTYAYDPYPFLDEVLKKIQDQTNLHLIVIEDGMRFKKWKNCTRINDCGPSEFLYLVKHASLVVTTSFHGTAFALNFGIPFFSVIQSKKGADSRMWSLLQKVGATPQAIACDEEIPDISLPPFHCYEKEVENFRNQSMDFLRRTIVRQSHDSFIP